MKRFLVASGIAISLAVSGCATHAGRPAGTIRRVRNDATAEVSDAVQDTRQRISRTWTDMLKDWNYDREDSFSEIRSAGSR